MFRITVIVLSTLCLIFLAYIGHASPQAVAARAKQQEQAKTDKADKVFEHLGRTYGTPGATGLLAAKSQVERQFPGECNRIVEELEDSKRGIWMRCNSGEIFAYEPNYGLAIRMTNFRNGKFELRK